MERLQELVVQHHDALKDFYSGLQDPPASCITPQEWSAGMEAVLQLRIGFETYRDALVELTDDGLVDWQQFLSAHQVLVRERGIESPRGYSCRTPGRGFLLKAQNRFTRRMWFSTVCRDSSVSDMALCLPQVVVGGKHGDWVGEMKKYIHSKLMQCDLTVSEYFRIFDQV